MYGTINRYLNSFSNNQCGLWIFECVNFLVKSNWLLHEMSTLCIGVPKPHTNVPRSFECKSYTFTLSNFKFNLYANTMLKICRFLLCIYRYVRSANEIILLVQLQPLYHPHTHTHTHKQRQKKIQSQTVTLNLGLLLEFRKVITRGNVVASANWIFHPLFGLILCFFAATNQFQPLKLFRSRIPNGNQVSMISWLLWHLCLYLLFRLS